MELIERRTERADVCACDMGFKSDSEQSEGGEKVEMRSLGLFGSGGLGNDAIKCQGYERNRMHRDGKRVTLRSSWLDMNENVADREGDSRSFWRKSCGAERDCGGGNKDRFDCTQIPPGNYDREGLHSIVGTKYNCLKESGFEKDVVERGDRSKNSARQEKDELYTSYYSRHTSMARGSFGEEKDSEDETHDGEMSPCREDRQSTYRTEVSSSFGMGSGLVNERGDAMRYSVKRLLAVGDQDALRTDDDGSRHNGKVSRLDRDEKKGLVIPDRRRFELDRDGGVESGKVFPGVGFGLERDGLEALLVSNSAQGKRSWHRSTARVHWVRGDGTEGMEGQTSYNEELYEMSGRKGKSLDNLSSASIGRKHRKGQDIRVSTLNGLRSDVDSLRQGDDSESQSGRNENWEMGCEVEPVEGRGAVSTKVSNFEVGVEEVDSMKQGIHIETKEVANAFSKDLLADKDHPEACKAKVDRMDDRQVSEPLFNSMDEGEMEADFETDGDITCDVEKHIEEFKCAERKEVGIKSAVVIEVKICDDVHNNMGLQSIGGQENSRDINSDNSKVSFPEADLEGQSIFIDGERSDWDSGIRELGNDFNPCQVGTGAVVRQTKDDKERKLHCKSTEGVTPNHCNIEVCEAGAFNFLSKTVEPIFHAEHSNLDLMITSPDEQKASDDRCVDLVLSLSTNLPKTEGENCKERDSLRDGRFKELKSIVQQRREEVQIDKNINVQPGEKTDLSDVSGLSSVGWTRKRPKLDCLQLCLALPDNSLKLIPSNLKQVSCHPELEGSHQSLDCTHNNSDASFSLSHFHSFGHNPSCSLTHTLSESQEYFCGSQQTSTGSWQAVDGNDQVSHGSFGFTGLSQDRRKSRRDTSLDQRLLQKGGQSHWIFSPICGSNTSGYQKVGSCQVSQESCQVVQILNAAEKTIDACKGKGSGLDKAWSSLKCENSERDMPSLEGGQCTPTWKNHSVMDENGGTSSFSGEKIGLLEIAMEPVAAMAGKLQELPTSFLEGLKGAVKEMLGNIEKREEFLDLQDIIKRRKNLTHETLLRANRTQLELLVALKTGMQAFVSPDCHSLTYKALIDIFLQVRCRNFKCQASLPVDGCECKICSQENGFCSLCMCMVCSKFDFDANTCQWVGCDFCMHWCHVDCGIRMCHIAPGPTVLGETNASEMLFRCIGCSHPSELFGFVKEVFFNFASGWKAETLAKELDCVRRIFYGSKDMRGKRLSWKAEEMLQKLEKNADTTEVCRKMLRYFRELDGVKSSAAKIVDLDQASRVMVKINSSVSNRLDNLDRPRSPLQTSDMDLEEKRTAAATRAKLEFEEIERYIQIKLAESRMFQLRADVALQEADGLRYIMAAKSERIEEEHANKIVKLRLNEAEGRRGERLEELQELERARLNYQATHIRMETDIRDLSKKMETIDQLLC